MIPIHPDWCAALDLGTDLAATEADVLYMEQALRDSGVRTVVYPWNPLEDPITPLGGTRPYKVLVPLDAHPQARELAVDVLQSRTERSDVLLPTDDAWAFRYQVSVIVLQLIRASRERGGAWRALHELLRIYLIGLGVAAAGSLVLSLADLFGLG